MLEPTYLFIMVWFLTSPCPNHALKLPYVSSEKGWRVKKTVRMSSGWSRSWIWTYGYDGPMPLSESASWERRIWKPPFAIAGLRLLPVAELASTQPYKRFRLLTICSDCEVEPIISSNSRTTSTTAAPRWLVSICSWIEWCMKINRLCRLFPGDERSKDQSSYQMSSAVN